MLGGVRAFDLHQPSSVAEAIGLLGSRENALVLGGGAVLTFLLRERLASADHLVSLTAIATLKEITERDGAVWIGATATLREIERSPVIRERLPVLAEAVRLVGNVRVRAVATIGGHLAQADVHLDLPPVLVGLGATVTTQRPSGSRTMAVADFITGYYETALQRAEIVTGVTVPLPPPGLAGAYLKFCALSQYDWPTVGVAAFMRASDGRASDVRIVAGAVADRPLRVPAAEALLEGATLPLAAGPGDPAPTSLAQVARLYAGAADPPVDERGSAEYKRRVTEVFVRRAVIAAAERAGGGRSL